MIYVLIIAAAGWSHPVHYTFPTLAECRQTQAAFRKEGAGSNDIAICVGIHGTFK